MPDHLHALCEGADDRSHLLKFVHMFKQRTAHDFKRQTRAILWQASFFDRHLRADEDLKAVVGYILANPVRAGLVQRADDYRHSGSATMSAAEMIAVMG